MFQTCFTTSGYVFDSLIDRSFELSFRRNLSNNLSDISSSGERGPKSPFSLSRDDRT